MNARGALHWDIEVGKSGIKRINSDLLSLFRNQPPFMFRKLLQSITRWSSLLFHRRTLQAFIIHGLMHVCKRIKVIAIDLLRLFLFQYHRHVKALRKVGNILQSMFVAKSDD